MSGKQQRFKQIMIAIAVIGVPGTILPNLLDSNLSASEKAVISTAFLIGIPLVSAAVYFVGKNLMKGR